MLADPDPISSDDEPQGAVFILSAWSNCQTTFLLSLYIGAPLNFSHTGSHPRSGNVGGDTEPADGGRSRQGWTARFLRTVGLGLSRSSGGKESRAKKAKMR